jgi:hypothetical protein
MKHYIAIKTNDWFVYMYIYIYTHKYTYIDRYIHTHIHTYVDKARCVCAHIPVVSELRGLRQEHLGFEVILGYIIRVFLTKQTNYSGTCQTQKHEVA